MITLKTEFKIPAEEKDNAYDAVVAAREELLEWLEKDFAIRSHFSNPVKRSLDVFIENILSAPGETTRRGAAGYLRDILQLRFNRNNLPSGDDIFRQITNNHAARHELTLIGNDIPSGPRPHC